MTDIFQVTVRFDVPDPDITYMVHKWGTGLNKRDFLVKTFIDRFEG